MHFITNSVVFLNQIYFPLHLTEQVGSNAGRMGTEGWDAEASR